jgi:hypothetical protein
MDIVLQQTEVSGHTGRRRLAETRFFGEAGPGLPAPLEHRRPSRLVVGRQSGLPPSKGQPLNQKRTIRK